MLTKQLLALLIAMIAAITDAFTSPSLTVEVPRDDAPLSKAKLADRDRSPVGIDSDLHQR